MTQQKISDENQEDSITSDDILGKDVIDSGGEFIGIVDKVFVNPTSIEIIGISIDKGFLKKGLEIGKTHIERISSYAVFLKIRPAFRLRGRFVFDINGKKLGKVFKVNLYENKNQIKSLVVKSGIFQEKYEIESKIISKIGRNVFLNDKMENLPKLNTKEQ